MINKVKHNHKSSVDSNYSIYKIDFPNHAYILESNVDLQHHILGSNVDFQHILNLMWISHILYILESKVDYPHHAYTWI